MTAKELYVNCGSGPPELAPNEPNRRAGFTLAELIISVGLLGLMMALAGTVFSLSVQSTNQATALMDVSQSLRLLEESLRADLAGIDPQRSLLVIDAHPINAYWTLEHQEGDADGDPSTGYPHTGDPEREVVGQGINTTPGNPPWRLEQPRADVLMFFTSRPATSAVYPSVRSNTVQVVYGHTELGELNTDGTWQVDPLVFPAPVTPPAPQAPFWNNAASFRDRYFARNWHLARREVLMVDALETDLETLLAIDIDIDPLWQWTYSPMEDANDTPPYLLSDGGLDFITLGNLGAFDYVSLVSEGGAMSIPTAEFARWYRRTRMDQTPPRTLFNRLGQYFLPDCASFKVEWALSDSALADITEVVWVDPADVAESVDAQLEDLGFSNTDPPRDAFAITGGGRFDPFDPAAPGMDATHEFFARDPDSSPGSDDPDPFFPRALRITVDVYDDAGRFERPMRHVMVIPVGNDS